MKWFTDILTGPNNATIAIGRVLGLVLFVNLLLVVPAVIVGVLLFQHSQWDTWEKFLASMIGYVAGVGATVTGIITLTHPTEPKP